MCKKDLLISFYKGNLTLDDLLTMTYFEKIEVSCIMKSPIYEVMISEDLCHKINMIYYDMTTKNVNMGRLTYDEIRSKFEDIKTQINFI